MRMRMRAGMVVVVMRFGIEGWRDVVRFFVLGWVSMGGVDGGS